MEPEICMKMFGNLSGKFGAKFPLGTVGYSMVSIAHLNDNFSGIFQWEASPVEGQSLQQKDKRRRKRKGKKKKKKQKAQKKRNYLIEKKY